MALITDNLRIRQAEASDIPAIVDLWTEMMDFHARRDAWFEWKRDDHTTVVEYFANRIGEGKCVVLVAELDGQVVGYSMAEIALLPPVFAKRENGAITEIAVTEMHRRAGIGTRLVEETISRFRKQGIKRIVLSCASANEVSRAFWRKMGFQPHMERLRLEI